MNDKLKEIVDFAIENEKSAVKFYRDLQGIVKFEAHKKLLHEFELMEVGHIKILQDIEEGRFEETVLPKVENLAISNYIVEAKPTSEMSYQDIIIIAMKREESANKLYTRLAEQTDDEKVKKLFLRLANEEAKHKLHFEKIYDDEILKEN